MFKMLLFKHPSDLPLLLTSGDEGPADGEETSKEELQVEAGGVSSNPLSTPLSPFSCPPIRGCQTPISFPPSVEYGINTPQTSIPSGPKVFRSRNGIYSPHSRAWWRRQIRRGLFSRTITFNFFVPSAPDSPF